jgi:hypothetical protein
LRELRMEENIREQVVQEQVGGIWGFYSLFNSNGVLILK